MDDYYNLDGWTIEPPAPSSYEAAKRGRNRRKSAIRSLDKRLDYLVERRDERGIDNPYISAEITALKWALSLMRAELSAYGKASSSMMNAYLDEKHKGSDSAGVSSQTKK